MPIIGSNKIEIFNKWSIEKKFLCISFPKTSWLIWLTIYYDFCIEKVSKDIKNISTTSSHHLNIISICTTGFNNFHKSAVHNYVPMTKFWHEWHTWANLKEHIPAVTPFTEQFFLGSFLFKQNKRLLIWQKLILKFQIKKSMP